MDEWMVMGNGDMVRSTTCIVGCLVFGIKDRRFLKFRARVRASIKNE